MPDSRRIDDRPHALTTQDRAEEAQARADRAQERAERAEAHAERAEDRAQEHSSKNRQNEPRVNDARGQMEQQMLGEMLVQAELEEAAEKQALKERALMGEREHAHELRRADAAEAEYTGQSGLARSDRNWTLPQPSQRARDVAFRAQHADIAASKAAVSASKAYTAHRELSKLVEQGHFTNPYARPATEASREDDTPQDE